MGASGVRSEPPTDQQTSTLGLTLEFLSYKTYYRIFFSFTERSRKNLFCTVSYFVKKNEIVNPNRHREV